MYRLLIDSRDRASGSLIESARYNLDKPLTDVSRVRVDYVMLYNTFYNVLEGMNNGFFVKFGGVDYYKALTPGYYSPSQLIAALNTKLKEVDASLGVTNPAGREAAWTLPGATITAVSYELFGLKEGQTGSFTTMVNTSLPQSISFFSPELSPQGGSRFARTRADVWNVGEDLEPLVTVPIFSANEGLNYWQPNYETWTTCPRTGLSSFHLELRLGGRTGTLAAGAIDYQIHLTVQ